MIDLLRWALQKHERSKDAARQRLQVILVLDRVGLAPEHMEAMKRDIIEAVSRYLVVDKDSIEMDMQRSNETWSSFPTSRSEKLSGPLPPNNRLFWPREYSKCLPREVWPSWFSAGSPGAPQSRLRWCVRGRFECHFKILQKRSFR